MTLRRFHVPCPWTVAIVALAVVSTALFLATSGTAPRVADHLVATRDGLVAGEVWRLVTGPFVHGTVEHLLRDTVSLVVFGFIAERALGRFFLPLVLVSLMLPTVAALASPPALSAYYGLSGVVHCILVAYVFRLVRHARGGRRFMAVAIAIAYAANLAFEMTTGGLLFPHRFGEGFHPVPVAHLAGALIGLAGGFATDAACSALNWKEKITLRRTTYRASARTN